MQHSHDIDTMKLVKASKFLSLILRHKPEVIGITLDARGWASLDDLVANTQTREIAYTEALVRAIVSNCKKQRFELSDDGRRVRCHQGHSLDIELGLKAVIPPELLYHGTASRFLESIMAKGLKKQRRHHVHLSTDILTATAVGSRYGTPVILTVLAGRMHEEGNSFYRSGNGVWLTDAVAPQYLLSTAPYEEQSAQTIVSQLRTLEK